MTSTLTRPATTLMDQGQINEALTLIYSGQWEGPNGTTLEEFEKCITAEFLDNQHTYVAELFCDEEEDEEQRIEAAEQLTAIRVIQAAHAQGKKISVVSFWAWDKNQLGDSYEFALAVKVAVV